MHLTNLKVSTRLTIGFGAMGLLLAVMVTVGIASLQSLAAGTALMADRKVPNLEFASDTLSQIDGIAIALRNMMLNEDPSDRRSQMESIKAARAKIESDYTELNRRSSTPAARELLADVQRTRQAYIAGQEQLAALIQAGNNAESKTFLAQGLRPALAAYKAAVNKLIAHEKEEVKATSDDAKATSRTGNAALLGIGGASLVLAMLVGWLIVRSLTHQLGGEPAYAAEVTQRIAAGDLATAVRLHTGDRSSLLFAMDHMREELARIVAQVRQGTDTIATASGQIAAGNQDLSQRTEEQASSLEETAASMEQLTGTVKQNADNARQANQLAQSASTVANEGGQVVSQVVTTMGGINEASRRIADIIGVIDSIAFQTNILALNAAVEAARAGEQGRGFAVVASEVRSLAHRSASAAKEIKALIDDSVAKVDAGSALVNRAGETMQQVVASINRVTDIMGEIAAASSEQTRGIEQVNQAVTQMDQVTQQNAALVEEASAAAQSMREQADQLVQAVSVFRVAGAAPRAGLLQAAAPQAAQRPQLPPVSRSAPPALARTAARSRAVSRTQSGHEPPAGGAESEWQEF